MDILAYGEDALTLWAIQNKISEILVALRDFSDSENCLAFFRPSFGRGGGLANFGEFDFILLTSQAIYLGESKWDGSQKKVVGGKLYLRDEQRLRHKLFAFYIREWAFGDYPSWMDFIQKAQPKLMEENIAKPLAPAGSLLATNLQFVLDTIRDRYTSLPTITNVLLYFFDSDAGNRPPEQASDDFEVVAIDYSLALHGRFINLNE